MKDIVKQLIENALKDMISLGASIDKRSFESLGRYVLGLMLNYTRSFSVFQMSNLTAYPYDRLQNLTSQASINEKRLNEVRVRWARQNGVMEDKIDIIIDDPPSAGVNFQKNQILLRGDI